MKALKKVIIALVILAIILAILVPLIIAPVVNNIGLSDFEKEVSGKALPNSTTIKQASYSEYGHLSGNDDSIEYFSSIVLVSNMTQEELASYYTDCVVSPLTSYSFQPEGMANAVEFSSLKTQTDFTNYYIVYKYAASDAEGIMGLVSKWDKTV